MSVGSVGVVVGRVAGRDGVGAAGGGVLHDVGEVGDRVVAGFELRLVADLLSVELVEAVHRARQAHAAAVDGDDRVAVQHVGAGTRQPHRQLQRRRQVRSGGEDQRAGVMGSLHRAGAHDTDAQRPGRTVDRVEVGVVACAIQFDAGCRGHRGVAEFLRRAVMPGQVVLGCGDRRRAVGRLRRRGVSLWPRARVGGEARVGSQPGRAAGQQPGHHDQRGGDCGVPAHADHSSHSRAVLRLRL